MCSEREKGSVMTVIDGICNRFITSTKEKGKLVKEHVHVALVHYEDEFILLESFGYYKEEPNSQRVNL